MGRLHQGIAGLILVAPAIVAPFFSCKKGPADAQTDSTASPLPESPCEEDAATSAQDNEQRRASQCHITAVITL